MWVWVIVVVLFVDPVIFWFSSEYENKYYKKTLQETYDGVGKGGTSFMS
jgi:hypothetical protein